MVDAFGDGIALSTLALNFLGVLVQWGHLPGIVELWAVRGGRCPDSQQPLHEPAQVCTRACLVVVHYSARSKALVDHVRAEWDSKHQGKCSLSIPGALASDYNALVGHVNRLLEVTHVLRRCR